MSVDTSIFFLRIVVIALVYLFLAQVLIVLRRDLRRATERPRWAKGPVACLVVQDAGQTKLPANEVFTLAEINTIGRASTNSIVLDDDFVSAEHALLSHRQSQWWIEDLDSTNGTLVNRRLIDRPTLISPGDVLQIGRVKLKLEKVQGAS